MFSLACPGLGHLYATRIKDASFYFTLQGLFLLIWYGIQVFAPPEPENVRNVLLLVMANLCLRLLAAINATMHTFNSEPVPLTPFNASRIYLGVFLGLSLLYFLPNGLGLSAWAHYEVQGPGMCPTLQVGEHLVIWKDYYRTHEPLPGDLVVYQEQDGNSRIRRIVGLPGETVQLQDGHLYIDGKPVGRLTVGSSYAAPQGKGGEYVEQLPSGCQYTILEQAGGLHADTQPVTVPNGQYYLLADNRNQAEDSRQKGPVPRSALTGKVSAYFWSADRNRIGQPVN